MPAAGRGGPRVDAKPRAKPAPGKTARPKGKAAGAAPRGRAPVPRHVSPQLLIAAAGGVLILAVGGALATGHRAQKIASAVKAGVDGRFAQAGLKLRAVHVEGASPLAVADIVKAAGVRKDDPMLGLDLDQVRQRIEAVGWVRDARVARMMPDTLVIAVVQRRQLAVWQHAGRTLVIDDHGQPIPEADPARFASLPLVVGDGGAQAAPAILPLIAQRPKLIGRMEALVRVDGRRWDLRMKDGSLIQLPAAGEEQALTQLEQLDQRSRVLELGFDRIDLRNPDVVAVRPRGESLPGLPPPAAGA
jgi:cell division protein FtsQ